MNIFNLDKNDKRTLIFLCGPYFNGKNINDRRSILRDYIHNYFNEKEREKEYLPLIIDYFLNKKNIKNEDIEIQLLEEIIAAISDNVFIFLDTVSASAELGLFSNNNYNNKVTVILPREKDIIRNNVGFFVREVMLNNNPEHVKYLSYNPKIIRNAISTDYVVEYYGFIDNKIPYEIEKYILDELDIKMVKKNSTYTELNKVSIKDNQINYYIKGSFKAKFHLTTKRIFYLIANIIYYYYRSKLEKGVFFELTNKDYSKIEKEIKVSVFLDYYEKESCLIGMLDKIDIEIEFGLNISLMKMIKHTFYLLLTYHGHGRYKNLSIIASREKLLLAKSFTFSTIPSIIFNFSINEAKLINSIIKNKQNFYENISIKVGNKVKYITKYIDEEKNEVKKLHAKIINAILKSYDFNDNSYAYKKKVGIKKCIMRHIDSNNFIKYDIKKFFSNIDKSILINKILDILNCHEKLFWELEYIVESLLANNNVPLGLMTSPLLSDIYLHEFDENITKQLEGSSIIYTRYADDILFSKSKKFSDLEEESIDFVIQKELEKLKLSINNNKFMRHSLNNEGDHFKYLGINIVKKGEKNIITVGKKYKNDIAKEYLNFITKKTASDKNKFYSKRRLAGKINYVNFIENEKGLNYLKNRVEKITQGRVTINPNILR